ncbi:MAG TPA: 50S ribosomal protein L24 [Candidatus Saccharimonadales bacterium]|jgi:large subunit ribosomal protein L24
MTVKMKVKKGDEVTVISGAHKGKTAKVVAAFPKRQAVALEGIGLVKRKVKPSQLNPRGGTKDIHVPVGVAKVKLAAAKPAAPVKAKTAPKKEGKK